MTSLYINNYRGFDEAFIELKDVNFFLGENSTGKTSILKLIKILSDPSFKIKYDLGEYFAEIGAFYDIVYKGGNKNYFQVGYCSNEYFINIVCKSRENSPVLHELYVMIEGRSIKFSFDNHKVDYKYVLEENNVHSEIDFPQWIQSIHKDKFDGENVLSGSSVFDERLPVVASFFALSQDVFGEEKEQPEGTKRKAIGEFYLSFFKAFESAPFPKLTWIDPIRAEPKRLYDEYSGTYTSSGSHAPYLLKKLLTSSKTKNNFKIKEFLKYGKASGLFSEIIPKSFDKKDDSSPFELLIALGDKSIKLNHVGYGVAQVLPLIVEIMNRSKKSFIAVQQPEVHLHPRAQAAFGDFLFAFAENDEKTFLVETHSDFLIDRFRLAMNKTKLSKKKDRIKAQVCFFERSPSGNVINYIPILNNGLYDDDLPPSFRDFFIKEQIELLSL